MPDELSPASIRQGFRMKDTFHRDELRRALDAAEQQLAKARAAFDAGGVDTKALHQLAVDAADASRNGSALNTLRETAAFACPADDTGAPPTDGYRPARPAVRKFLDLSAQYLPEYICHTLGQYAVTVYETSPDRGWLLWVPDEQAGDRPGKPVPDEVTTILRYARSRGCAYVLFDRDGDIYPNIPLPTWDW